MMVQRLIISTIGTSVFTNRLHADLPARHALTVHANTREEALPSELAARLDALAAEAIAHCVGGTGGSSA